MKGLEKFLLVVFSIIVIVISMLIILTVADVINLNSYVNYLIELISYNKVLTIALCGIFVLLALTAIFTSSDSGESAKSGLAIKSEKGTVYITKDTFESIIMSVARNYPELRNVRADINISEKGVVANIFAMILPDTVVPTLTAKLQDNIKTSVLEQTTVEIKEANIKIKGVYIEQSKK